MKNEKKRYKLLPYINPDNNKKGWIIVHNDKYERVYSSDGNTFTIYYNFDKAEEHCDHLNGDGKVWGIVTKNNWELFKDFMRYPK